MRMTTQKEGEEIYKEAEEWFNVLGKKHFPDSKTLCTGSVAEYIANQRGLTLFPEEK